MSTADKLNKLIETKEAIRQSIIAKGTDVGEDVPFSQYPSKIDKIETVPVEYENPWFYEMRTNNGVNYAGLFSYTNSNLDLSNLDTSKCTDMKYAFDHCSGNITGLNNWNIDNVKDMGYMFYYCSIPNLDLSGWDINGKKNGKMFSNCSSNVNIDEWNTSEVTDFSYFLEYFSGSIDISNLDYSNATNINYFFNYAKLTNIKGIENLHFPKVTSLDHTFYQTKGKNPSFSLDLSKWDIRNITNLSYTFGFSNAAKIDLSGWKTTNVTNMSNTFYYLSYLEELIIPDWDMTNVTSSSSFLSSVSKLRYIDLSRSNDTTLNKILTFLPTKTLASPGEILIPNDTSESIINSLISKYWKPVGPKLDLVSCEIASELGDVILGKNTKIHVGKVEPWYGDVKNNFELVVADDNIASIDDNGVLTAHSVGSTEIYAVLKDTRAVISNTINVNVTETDLNPYTIKFKGTGSPSNSYNFIYVNGTNSVNKVLLSSIVDYNEVSGVYTYDVGEPITSIKFCGYNSSTGSAPLTCTDVVKLNIENITSMHGMFEYCSAISALDLSDWDISKVTDITNIFRNCTSLTSIICNVKETINRLAYELPYNTGGTIYTKCNPEDLDMDKLENRMWKIETEYSPEIIYTTLGNKLLYVNGIDVSDYAIEILPEISMFSEDQPKMYKYVPEETITSVSFQGNMDLLEVNKLDTSKVADMSDMFNGCTSLAVIPDLDTSSATKMDRMFYNCSSMAGEIDPAKYWNNPNVMSFDDCFFNCESVDNVEELPREWTETVLITGIVLPDDMVCGNRTYQLTHELIPADTTQTKVRWVSDNENVATVDENGLVTRVGFGDVNIACISLHNSDIRNTVMITFEANYPIIFKAIDNTGTFSLNGNTINVSDCINDNGEYKYNPAGAINTIKFGSSNITELIHLDISEITDMGYIFSDCEELISVNVSNWDTSNVTTMFHMFGMDYNIEPKMTNLNLSNWNVSKVTNMAILFYWHSGLETLDISNWNTSSLKYTYQMFYQCSKLKNIKGTFDLSNVCLYSYSDGNPLRDTFSHCSNLEDLSLINIYKNTSISNSNAWSISLSDTKVKDKCLISIINELPDLINDKGLTATDQIIFTLPPTNTLTAEQVQPAIDKGWTVANVNSNVINEVTTYSLRRTENIGKVYKLVENENGDYQSQDGTMYDILEANNAVSPEGINVGWTPFDNLEQAMTEFQVTYVPKTLED